MNAACEREGCDYVGEGVHYNRTLKIRICRKCNRELFPPKRIYAICSKCDEYKEVAYYDENGGPWCNACYKREIRIAECGNCGKTKSIEFQDPKLGPICGTCHKKLHKKGICFDCKEEGILVTRKPHSKCSKCYSKENYVPVPKKEKPQKVCSFCGEKDQEKILYKDGKGGNACVHCYTSKIYKAPTDTCANCKKKGRVAVRTKPGDQLENGKAAKPNSAICPTCYYRYIYRSNKK